MLLRGTPQDLLLRPLTRSQALGLLLRLTIFGTVTYFSIKWVCDALDPTREERQRLRKKAQRLMKKVGVEGLILTEHEMNIASHLVNPRDIKVTWKDIAGLDDVIEELQDTVILPFQKRHLFKHSKLCQPPKGVLLHGPPGCGKTLLAKAIARASGCQFINLQAASLTDKWYGESQKLTASVFSLATKLQPCIIFIDEIDSFLRNRSCMDHEATAMIKAQFMSLWDGLDTSADSQVMILGASNRPQDVDSAILRRMPVTFQICQPLRVEVLIRSVAHGYKMWSAWYESFAGFVFIVYLICAVDVWFKTATERGVGFRVMHFYKEGSLLIGLLQGMTCPP
ncbi:outer mitochondrial transmembrane helix translocase-like isoform X2 [Ambystoma mexicanum]|uniref:outer mitochondrial transmembrane helix translocase-like isoform X2 n=1 Tax=Ambystoma mexicanum TaxID=8296 RepID=UPI0037E7DD3A